MASVAESGASATTAGIARRAGVAQGLVFHYFETKGALLNAVFLQLKQEIHAQTLDGLPESAPPLAQLEHLWQRWLDWGLSAPERHRALHRLNGEAVITDEARDASASAMARGIGIVRAVSAGGVFAGQPIQFVARFFEALATATVESMIADPAAAKAYRQVSFEALVRAIR